jgi:hypothetical protein
MLAVRYSNGYSVRYEKAVRAQTVRADRDATRHTADEPNKTVRVCARAVPLYIGVQVPMEGSERASARALPNSRVRAARP